MQSKGRFTNKRQKKKPPGLIWFMVQLSEPLDLGGIEWEGDWELIFQDL